jgi:hypothetical protein
MLTICTICLMSNTINFTYCVSLQISYHSMIKHVLSLLPLNCINTFLLLMKTLCFMWPPLWSSGKSSWLQIQSYRFNSRDYQIFCEVVGLERGSLSLVSTTEELLERKSIGSDLQNRNYSREGSSSLTIQHSLSIKVGIDFVDKRRPLYSLFAD